LFQLKPWAVRFAHHTSMEQTKRVLVVEDDPILRDLIGDWLLAAGYCVGLAAEGRSGIAEAQAQRPALVVTDIHMPGVGGATVIAEVTRLYPGIPVIAISGHFRSEDGLTPEQAMALGARRTLAKPFKRQDVIGAVRELVGPPGG
jgi:two-component system response regulator FlrC